MGRRRKARKQGVSLFPFLDILACVIGNLMLIIATVVLEQVDTQPMAEAARVAGLEEEAARAQAKAAELQQQVEDLRKRSGAASATLDAVREKIAAAKRRLAEAEARSREAAKPIEQPPAVAVDGKALDASRKQLEIEMKELEQKIAERQKQPEHMIAILPPGERSGPRTGVFVETAKDGLVVHDPSGSWRVPTGKIAADPKFKQLLERVKGDKDAIVTFLVRSDGLASLGVAQKAAAAAGVRSGRVPLPGDGTIDLSGAR
jgi:hypothetical protein